MRLAKTIAIILAACWMPGLQNAIAENTAVKAPTVRKLLFVYPNRTDLHILYEGGSQPIAAVQGKNIVVTQQIEKQDTQRVMQLLTAFTFSQMARTDRANSNYVEAEKHFKMAITEALKAGGDNPIAEIATLGLAGLYLHMDKEAQAEILYKDWLEKADKSSPDSGRYAAILDNLAQALTAQHKFAEAEKCNLRSITLYRQMSPEPIQDIAGCLNSLAILQIKQKKCAEAETTIKEALKLSEEVGDKRTLAIQQDTLASTFYCRRMFKEAFEAHKKALPLFEQAYGPDHPECGICLGSIGHCAMQIGDYKGAAPYLERAIKIVSASRGPNCAEAKQLRTEYAVCIINSSKN